MGICRRVDSLRRFTCFQITSLHITNYMNFLLCSSSILGDNYRHLMYKYNTSYYNQYTYVNSPRNNIKPYNIFSELYYT